MSKYRPLNIKGAVLDKDQLIRYMENLASDHILQDKSSRATYPIPTLKYNFSYITKVYHLLNEHLKLGISIHPAGEWLLDNYYIIEETVKIVEKDLKESQYINFLGIANGMYKGYARIYVLASEIIAYTGARIDHNNLELILRSYQNKKTLNMEEIWNISLFLQIALIGNIKEVCEKIYLSQMQKYTVENMIERLVEGNDQKNFKIDAKYKSEKIGFGELKYPFIEYMSYRLKRLGRKALPFLDVLEVQVEKTGTTISDVIKKEHFDIAIKKVSMAETIKSMKNLLRINFLQIFENINGVEEILKKDPANIYEKMDYKTKEEYRTKIKKISQKTKTSEIYIANKLIEISNKYEVKYKKEGKKDLLLYKKTHVGYFLIADGKYELLNILQPNKKHKNKMKVKQSLYMYGMYSISFILSIILGIYLHKIGLPTFLSCVFSIFVFVPITEFVTQVLQYILNKIVNKKIIPKLDVTGHIPKELKTMVVIPTIISNKMKIDELVENIEVYYLANKSENLYFAILGDCKNSNKEKEEYDNEIIEYARQKIIQLNEKYKEGIFPKFHMLYRSRKWNKGEKTYLGWERKRGLLNQFNQYLIKGEDSDFIFNTIKEYKEERKEELEKNNEDFDIKYVITLDQDTKLILDSAFLLIGAMGHILNTPILNDTKDAVVDGYAIIQPRVGIDIVSSKKSMYTKIFAGMGGTDHYANAISDVYQDNFFEGIFTGKGIYDLKVFEQVLENEIPENTVLSHDLLEGSYLRCGLSTDILVMDGYPHKYNAGMSRLTRWIRGDWQILQWLRPYIINKEKQKKKNPLNSLSKFKILDNLRRSMVEIFFVLSFLFLGVLKLCYKLPIWNLVILLLIIVFIPTILDIINAIIFRDEKVKKQKTFTKEIGGLLGSFYRGFLNFLSIPHKAYLSINAIIKTIYRMRVSKQNLLEWVTAEEAEKLSKTDLKSYYITMMVNPIVGILTILFGMLGNSFIDMIIGVVIGSLWMVAPFIFCTISKEEKELPKIKEVSKEDKEYILNIGEKTWKYFKDYLTQETNFLPPDNYQEDRPEILAYRSSSTNIGLGLLSVVSAYDLGYEKIENTIDLIENILNTILSLPKWNGHLYNWYDIKTLQPLIPRYISTVDNGNLVGYLFVLKQFLLSIQTKEDGKEEKIVGMINNIEELINHMDFSLLYDEEQRLFSIGFNVEENKLTDSYYDLLASEARQASLVAIAKHEVPAKHWNNLSRTLTVLNRHKGLISWSGTAFEYLMPNINIKRYPGSLLDESCKFMIMSQKLYSQKLGIPWGISESAFYLKDLNSNYQYKAFGIPWLGLKRGLDEEIVVSSYGSILAINDIPNEVIKNIKKIESLGGVGEYGLYEAIDYTLERLDKTQEYAIVKTYMAHHQGLILLSINNLINSNILQKRFEKNPDIKAVDILLQERMPERIILTNEKKEDPKKLQYKDYEVYVQKTYTKINDSLPRCGVISNEDYTVVTNKKGDGYSKYEDIYINRYKKTDEIQQGIYFFIKNIKSNRIWTSNYMDYLGKPDKYSVSFLANSVETKRQDGNIQTTTKTTICPNENVEIRNIELVNNGLEEETIEISTFLEPILSKKESDYSHKAFNNLFLNFEYEEKTNSILVKRKKRQMEEEDIYLGVSLFTEDETVGDLEYEIDKEKLNGRDNLNVPIMIKESKPFSKQIGLVTDPVISFKRTMKLPKSKKINLTLIITVSHEKEEVITNIENYQNTEKIKRTFELSLARSGEEIRYLGLKAHEVEGYGMLLPYLICENPLKKQVRLSQNSYLQSDLWKYGISGDLPILLVKIKDINDYYVIEDALKAYEYLKIKNMKIDLVILDEEKFVYEQYVRTKIESLILSRQLSYMKNNPSGIYVLNANEMEKEDKELLEFRANIIIDAHLGEIASQIMDLEEKYMDNIKNIGYDNVNQTLIKEEPIRSNFLDKVDSIDNLKYYNEYGAFSSDGKEYIIKVNKDISLPTTWSHILANEQFGSVITEGMGGYTWCENSRLNRITAWNNNPVLDIPSEVIYIKDKNTKLIWSLGKRPMPDENDYYITYGFGYAKYEHTSSGIVQELNVFVPKKDKVKVNLLKLKNTNPEKKTLKLYYYIKPVLGEDEIKSNGYIETKKDGEKMLYARNLYGIDEEPKISYIGSSQDISSYTGSKEFFIGNGTISNPEGIKKVSLDNDSGLYKNSCMVMEIEVEIPAYEEKEISFIIGQEENIINVKDISYKYSNIENCKEELKVVKKFWCDLLSTIQIKTPIESMNILLNGWALYQTIVSRLWGRSGYYQSGGAFGFRDQLQDTISLKYIAPEMMKSQILKHAAHQFIEGDVEHWWHDETKRGIRTRFSDDLLWLPYLVCEYIEHTKDIEILDIEVPYLIGKKLEEGIDEKYDLYLESEEKGNIYDHCIRAIEKSLTFGPNELPKIGSGDWNDGFSNIGPKGIGVSIWLGFFLYDILTKFIKVCDMKVDFERSNKYEEIKENLKRTLNQIGWDGRWFKRAITDDGKVIGSIESEEGRIDSISQSWGVISKASDNDKKYISMESLENHLVDKENGIIKLLDPPFDKSSLEPGYIKSYLPGVRENGGQYTHAAIWAIIAQTKLGFGDKAEEFFRIINPIEHSRTKESAKKYKVEPYVIPADVYGARNLIGRGGWTWYTGSSSWMYKAGIEDVLGLEIKGDILRLNPCIPKDWEEFSIAYKYKSSLYNIRVKNPNKRNMVIEKLTLDGEEIKEKEVKLVDNGRVYNIEVEM